jgi:uncharacterized protein YndB with AHSA1/START domain
MTNIHQNRKELTFTRIIEASLEHVWKAWTEPEHFMHWWGPRVFTAPLIRIDLRVGGRYLWCMRSPEGQDFCNTGVYREIVPMKRIVYTQKFADTNGNFVPASQFGLPGDWPPEITVAVTFEQHDERTKIIVQEDGIPEEMSVQAATGMNESLDKLAAYLEQRTDTHLIAELGKQEILITRVFNAPPDVVFRVSTDPALIPRWWGPKRMVTTVDRMDVRSGGVWRFIQRDPEGNEYAFHGIYHEVTPPGRLVQTFEFEGMPGHALLEAVTFETRDGKTRLTDRLIFQNVADRDGMLQSGMEGGVSESHDRLDELVEKIRWLSDREIEQREHVQESSNSVEGRKLVAWADTRIYASLGKVWDALINPEIIRQYMFGTEVLSDWKEGSTIIWRGEWEGKYYVDRGVILRLEPQKTIQYSHFSPLSGLPDTPENYHTVIVNLAEDGEYTQVSLMQDNNPTEQEREHSQKNWEMMLAGLKKLLESEPIRRLFAEYEKAFTALDMEKSAEIFADTFISAGPRGAIAQSKADFLNRAHQAAEFYRSAGQTSAKILSMQETIISNEYTLVKVHWGVTFRKTGDKLIEFDVSYLVQKIGAEPKIILFIAHEDEEKAMKELEAVQGSDRPK